MTHIKDENEDLILPEDTRISEALLRVRRSDMFSAAQLEEARRKFDGLDLHLYL